VKTFGIYLAYPPWTRFEGEGLGRFLAAFVRGGSEAGQVRFVIACPGWTREALEELFASVGLPGDAVEFLCPRGVPGVVRLGRPRPRRRDEDEPRRPRSRRRRLPQLRQAGERLLGWLARSRSPLPLVLASLVIAPLVAIGGLVRLVGRPLSRLVRAPLVAIGKGITAARRGSRRGFEKLATSEALYASELRLVHELIDARSDIEAWYCPTAFWPSFNRIRGPRVLCVPDFVVSLCPVAFAQLGGEPFRGTIEKIEETIRGGDRFVTYSHHVKHDTLVGRFGIDPDRVAVVPHGANTLDDVLEAAAVRRDHPATSRELLAEAVGHAEGIDGRTPVVCGDVPGPYLFYASQLRPHKNIPTLLKAFRWLLDEGLIAHRLVLTCSPAMSARVRELVATLSLHDDVLFLVRLSEEQLAACYRHATLAVNPSLSEGACPFTFAEALSVGTPVVMARIPVTEEVIDDPRLQEAMLFDPYDWRDMARVIARGVSRREDLLSLQLPAYERIARRTWREVSGDYVRVLEAAAGEPEASPRRYRRPA
jgi:glycosyltransferase involved in cell wall biosynthesis